jgi:hypothetical protein
MQSLRTGPGLGYGPRYGDSGRKASGHVAVARNAEEVTSGIHFLLYFGRAKFSWWSKMRWHVLCARGLGDGL